MTLLAHYLGPIEAFLRDYGYLAVFLGVFLESFGLPLPGESLVISSALVAAQGDYRITPLLAVIWLAAVLGDNLGYLAGHFAGRRLVLRYGAKVGITEARFARVEASFIRFGAAVVLFARFFVLLRQLNGLTAGTLSMPWWRFLLYNAVGAALWSAVWGLGVYLIGHDIPHILTWAQRFGYAVVIAAGAAVLALLALHRWRRNR